jgi:hypothetical protein
MSKFFVTALCIFISIHSFSQTEIKVDSARSHVGEIVKVCTKVFGGKTLDNAKGTPTLLDAGAAYPNQLLTILIWGDKKENFKNPVATYYMNKNVCIIGKVLLYKDKPEIVLNTEDQITLQ